MTSLVEQQLFANANVDFKNVVLTKEQFASQDEVYKLMTTVLDRRMLPWASQVFQRLCSPDVDTTRIATAKQFFVTLSAVAKGIQDSANEHAKSWLVPASQMRQKNKNFQYGLARRARNMASWFLSFYILQQWQRSAVLSIFLNIVEKEVFDDHLRGDVPTMYHSYYTCEDGYTRAYDRKPKDISIGEQVGEKLFFARFGRQMIWAFRLYTEMKQQLEQEKILPSVCFSPIYLQLQNSGEPVPALLEFFMRLMYVSVIDNVAAVHKREKATGHTTTDLPAEFVDKFFNVSLLITERSFITGPKKRAKKSNDDDDNDQDAEDVESSERGDEKAVKFSLHTQHPLCGDTNYASDCLPHDRTLSAILEVTAFGSIFTILGKKDGSFFGSVENARESCYCLWVVWLQNVQNLYQLAKDNASGDKKASDEDLHLAAVRLLTCTPTPFVFTCLMDGLRQFIERHHSVLLHETGFDLNHNMMITQIFRHIGVLCDFFSISSSSVLDRHLFEQKIKK